MATQWENYAKIDFKLSKEVVIKQIMACFGIGEIEANFFYSVETGKIPGDVIQSGEERKAVESGT